jgi:DNA-binding SARP family transcriptional activator
MKTKFSIALLGPFRASYGDKALRRFRTNKVKALLIYLVTEAAYQPGIEHRREFLMDLLWPDLPLGSAQENLRQTLYHLRKTLGKLVPTEKEDSDPAVLVSADRQVIQIAPESDHELDVITFTQLLQGERQPEQLEQAVTLYRGDFLADFYLPDSAYSKVGLQNGEQNSNAWRCQPCMN